MIIMIIYFILLLIRRNIFNLFMDII